MRVLLTAIFFLGAGTSAFAISRYDIGTWSCDRVRATLAREGAAILRYRSARNPSLVLYDRYVKDVLYCDTGQVFRRTSVPTADTKSCPVRKCIEYEPPDSR